MLSYKWWMCTSIICVGFLFSSAISWNIGSSGRRNDEEIISETIVVDSESEQGCFRSIQAAIDSIPSNNQRWIRIHIKPGFYREQVLIPRDKPFTHLRGSGKRNTFIVWNGHDDIAAGATFASEANNTLAQDITFTNSYNSHHKNPMARAVAARIQGDKSAFYRCRFLSLQDTLWDVEGRHYFKSCTIHGAVDYIFGAGQSLYEGCTISVAALNGTPGYITAQGRGVPNDTSGFVFKHCNIVGRGKAYLGRPWRDYARVLFYNTSMNQLALSEYNSRGPGGNSSERVKWAKKMTEEEAKQLASISFIDNEGWLNKAFNIFASPTTIVVDPSGKGGFRTIQAAINSVPSNNQVWTTIDIKPGIYREQVSIPQDKPFIYLKGAGKRNTFIVWDAHINSTAAFTSEADNTLAKDITFINSYNSHHINPIMGVAVAARIRGDKSVFYHCGFSGLQNTLWDDKGRHYFKFCTIHGAVDYIFGAAQSLYESCRITVASLNRSVGFITAQGRGRPEDTSGFVFKHCTIFGDGKAYLGRPWREYARVLFYSTSMSEAVDPQGWSIGDKLGKE
ncbi:hypothetical protein C2S52_006331 [Perilla frutescens var. hirtella]|nr:hypothetical protein C2S52_006331 [Perilla frutescens var. hirtella]